VPHPTSTQNTPTKPATVPHVGHGAQVDRDDAAPATASQFLSSRAATAPADRGAQLAPALALLGLLLALATGTTWLHLRHRPRKAV
jgi:hypothetical protein